mgnify:FL=1
MIYILCFFVGALYTLSFSPYSISILSIASIVILLLLLDLDSLKDAIMKSFLFSVGYFLVGTYWLENVINHYTDISFFITSSIIFLFIVYLSSFIVIPVVATYYLKQNLKLDKNYALIIMAILITFFEILRSFLFTGFSWFNFGQAALDTPLSYFFPIFGVHGLTLIIFLISLLTINIIRGSDLKFYIPLSIIILSFYVNIYSKEWTFASNEKINISIIQPNIANKLSYEKKDITFNMKTLNTLTLQSLSNNPDIILWPEAPLPVLYSNIKNTYYENILEKIPSSTSLVSGSFSGNNNTIFNSLINITDSKNIYHKKHLVPFGEYLPYRDYLLFFYSTLGISILDISKGNNLHSIGINNYLAHSLICYESIFSNDSLVKNPNIDFIINVTNDGWFGNSLAPIQHLDALRMRSLENQRYSVRAANSGISAFISPYGDIIEYLPYGKKGTLNYDIYPINGLTPISQYGYNLLYIFIFFIFLYSTIYYNFNVFRRKN